MKLAILFFTLIVLTGCLGDSSEVKKAKQELGVIPVEAPLEEIEKTQPEENTFEDVITQGVDRRISQEYISGERMLILGTLDYKDFKSGYVKIEGETLGEVEKIRVDFSNSDSSFPNDSFMLKKFKAGGKDFEYNASSKFKVLDFGVNEYTFTAFHGGIQSKLLLKVLVSENDDELLDGSVGVDSGLSTEIDSDETNEIDVSIFPEGEQFGNVINLGNNEFTYSGVKGLSITKEKLGSLNCGVDEINGNYFISDFLKERMNSWYYWNTCRSIVKDKVIAFYIIRLQGEEYIYEKHYVDIHNGLYGVYEIETGTGIDKDTIAEKNTELKAKNAEFVQAEVVDGLFRDLLK